MAVLDAFRTRAAAERVQPIDPAHWVSATVGDLLAESETLGDSPAVVTALTSWMGRRDARQIAAHLDAGMEWRIDADKGLDGVRRALRICRLAQALSVFEDVSADGLNALAWAGVLRGLVRDVSFAAEEAVRRQPQQVNFVDTRGVCRALSGDLQGALADFRKFLADPGWAAVVSPSSQVVRQRRVAWVAALEQGVNPLTEQELAELRRTEE
jgi:hypothetical protein